MPDDQIPVMTSSDQVPDEVSQETTISPDSSATDTQAQPDPSQGAAPQPGAQEQTPAPGQASAQPGTQPGQSDQSVQKTNPTQQRAATNPTTDATANANHPMVKKAGVLRSIAETLAGGPRYKTTIDPNTGTSTREAVPLSGKQIGLAIAMEALSGFGAGLAGGAHGGGAGGAIISAQNNAQNQMQMRQQQDGDQAQRAQADYARHAQVFETNLRQHATAVGLGKQDFDTNQKYVDGYADLYKHLQENNPKAIKGVVNEDQLEQFHVTKQNAIPVGVVKRVDPKDPSKQAVDQYGAPQWEMQYAIVDPSADVDLSPEEQDEAHKYGITGFINSEGEKTKMPQDARTKLGTMMNIKGQVAALKLTEGDLKNYYNTLNNKSDASKTPAWSAFPDIDKLADAMTDFEGGNIGDRNMRNNNPGNIKATNKNQKQDSGGFRIFDSLEEGKAEQSNLLQRWAIQHPDWTIEDLIHRYSPDSDPGNGKGQESSYVTFLRKRAGLPADDSVDNASNQKYDAPDLAAMVRKDPTLAKAVQKFMPMYNHTGDIGGAVDELAKSDPSAAGKIANLYGGRQAMQDYATQRTLSVEAQKDKVKADAQLGKEAQSRSAKNAENYDSYRAVAKAIAGDPNDPGSGDLDELDKVISQRTADRPKVLAMIKEINPNFNMDDAKNRIQVKNDFTTDKGVSSKQIKSVNTLFDHIGAAIDINDAYRGRSDKTDLLNKPLNWWAEHAENDPLIAEFRAAIEPVKSEFMTFLQNNHALTEHDKKSGDVLLSEKMTPALLEASLKRFAETAAYRAKETNQQWYRAFNRNFPGMFSADAVHGIQKLTNSDGTNKVADILKDMDTGGTTTGSSNGRGRPGQTIAQAMGRTQQGQQPNQQGQQPQYSQIRRNPATGEQVGLANGKWVPIPKPGQQQAPPQGQF